MKVKINFEGTGSLVLDRENKICYAISMRTDEQSVLHWCDVFDYAQSVLDKSRCRKRTQEIYHTNVMMCITNKYVVCLDSVDDKEERKWLRSSIELGKR